MVGKENEILHLMKTLDISREEAEQLWEDDNSDEMLPEVAELTEKAKKNLKRQYEINPDKKRKASTKERKVNTTKKFLLEKFAETLASLGIEEMQTKTETEVSFEYDNKKYTLKLTEHIPPKTKAE